VGATIADRQPMPGYTPAMDYAIWIEPDPDYLEMRRERGLDKKDEVWDGVLHMVPTPSGLHETIAHDLMFALKPTADRLGLVVRTATTGVCVSEHNYRIPDISFARPDQMSKLGLSSALLVVEVLSKNDESRQKFGYYAARGILEIWLVDPATRAVEMYQLVNGAYVAMIAQRSKVLGVTLELTEMKLRVIDGDRVVEI
jgi:Uma2 family endonuclease